MAQVSDPFAMSCVLSTMGLVALMINAAIVVKFGRRRVLLISGLTICGFLQLIIAVVYHEEGASGMTGKVLVALSCLYMMSYNVSLPSCFYSALTDICQGMIATYAWLAGGEIPSQRLRSYTFGLAAAIGFFFAWLTTLQVFLQLPTRLLD